MPGSSLSGLPHVRQPPHPHLQCAARSKVPAGKRQARSSGHRRAPQWRRRNSAYNMGRPPATRCKRLTVYEKAKISAPMRADVALRARMFSDVQKRTSVAGPATLRSRVWRRPCGRAPCERRGGGADDPSRERRRGGRARRADPRPLRLGQVEPRDRDDGARRGARRRRPGGGAARGTGPRRGGAGGARGSRRGAGGSASCACPPPGRPRSRSPSTSPRRRRRGCHSGANSRYSAPRSL
jgi:hypothetical protein